MLPDRVSNPGPLTYESGALPIALRGPAAHLKYKYIQHECIRHQITRQYIKLINKKAPIIKQNV